MKNTWMVRTAAGAVVALACVVTMETAESVERRAYRLYPADASRLSVEASARLEPAAYEPIRYPEDPRKRQLAPGRRSIWDWVQAVMSAPLM